MRRRMAMTGVIALTAAALPALTVTTPAYAAGKGPVGSYIVVMRSDPLVRSVTTRQLGTPQAKGRRGGRAACTMGTPPCASAYTCALA